MSKMLFENVDVAFTHIDELSKKRNAQPVYYRGQHHNLRTPHREIGSTGEIEQRFRWN